MKQELTRERIAPRLVGWLVVVALVGSGCSSGTSPVTDDIAAPRRGAGKAAASVSDRNSNLTQDGVAVAGPDELPEINPGPVNKPEKNDETLDGPEDLILPWKPEVDVIATLSPNCVARGEMMTVTIRTEPEAAIAYQAVYADNKGGADEPLGGGYGGNAGGHANSHGEWSGSWVVSPKAPVGPARVDVIIGWEQKWGYDGPEFVVVRSLGDCD